MQKFFCRFPAKSHFALFTLAPHKVCRVHQPHRQGGQRSRAAQGKAVGLIHKAELREKQAYITRVIRNEEENFAKTIDAGMHIFSDLLAEHQAKGELVFSGADAFKLYDTYGFPIDLTREMVQEQDMTVDEDAFQNLMEQQRVRARKAREALGDLAWA